MVNLSHTGIVLRGSGSGRDPKHNTIIIQSSRSGQDTSVLRVGNNNSFPFYSQFWDKGIEDSVVTIMNSAIPIGQTSFTVSNSQPFRIGDIVIVRQQVNDEWYEAVNDGGTVNSPGWRNRSFPWMDLSFTRFVTHLNGSQITIDAPLYNHLDKRYGALIMFKHNANEPDDKLYRNVGVEHLRIYIETLGGVDTKHTERGIEIVGVIDGWINDVSIQGFSRDGIRIEKSTRITVQNTSVGPPVARNAGGYSYGFQPSGGAQQILFKNCSAIATRHGFILNGSTRSSGIVFYRCKLVDNIASSEGGHRQWSMGALFDGCTVVNGSSPVAFLLGNRGDYGTSHGWGAVNSVLWNSDTGGRGSIVVQQPPTAQNYMIGGFGNVEKHWRWPGPVGFVEGTNENRSLFPSSLYEAQLLAWQQ